MQYSNLGQISVFTEINSQTCLWTTDTLCGMWFAAMNGWMDPLRLTAHLSSMLNMRHIIFRTLVNECVECQIRIYFCENGNLS